MVPRRPPGTPGSDPASCLWPPGGPPQGRATGPVFLSCRLLLFLDEDFCGPCHGVQLRVGWQLLSSKKGAPTHRGRTCELPMESGACSPGHHHAQGQCCHPHTATEVNVRLTLPPQCRGHYDDSKRRASDLRRGPSWQTWVPRLTVPTGGGQERSELVSAVLVAGTGMTHQL